MADNKSCEDKLTTLECMECGYREVFTERQFEFTDGLRCYVCEGLVRPSITRPGEKIRNRRMKENIGETTAEAGRRISESLINISETIKGLKAIQREAKKATAALKELEGIRADMVVFDEMHICLKCGSDEMENKKIVTDNGLGIGIIRLCKKCDHGG